MADLTDAEAKRLLELLKRFEKSSDHQLPRARKTQCKLISTDGKESFILDIGRGTIEHARAKYQMRGRGESILARLDLHGAPHRNPDGESVECPHIHIYREGYADKWAYPLATAPGYEYFLQCSTLEEYYLAFLEWCNVEKFVMQLSIV